MYEELISKMVDRKAIYPKGYKPLSLRKKVLSLVAEANKNAPIERRVIPRSALTVMNRANASLSSLSDESRELGVLREVAKFITVHQDTFKAYEYSSNIDLLPIGHPRSSLNITASSDIAQERYAQWLSSDPSIDNSVRPLIATAHSLEPGSIQRRHAFARLRVTLAGPVSSFFKIDDSPIKALVAAFGFSSGNSSAARRARVALQWRDRYGRWVEMGGGLNFNFRLPNGDIGNAAGNFVGVNANSGYSIFEGKEIVNAGYIEVRGDNTIPDGIYSIESANATPVKARISKETLKREKISREPSTRKPTAKEASSKDIPTLDDLLKTKVDAPTGWTKQDDGSFTSDDDYKLIPNESGFALHRLDKDGNTGDKVGDAASWAEAQSLAEKDSPDYDKFKESVKAQDGEPKAVIPENLPMEGAIEGTDIRYEIKTGPGQLGGRMRDGRIRLRERAAVEGNIAGLYLIGDTSSLELPNLERNEVWRGADGGNRNTIIERPSPPHPFAEDPVAVAKRIVAKLNEANKNNDDVIDAPAADLETPPALPGEGETQPKPQNLSAPTAPALFNEFDVPSGAFQLRTVDFEPDGRVDEESTDFTDDPDRLAVKYTLPQLSVALTQALIGDRDDAIFNEIIESSIGDDGELLELEEVDDVVDSPAPAAGRANGSGAGQLEFNKGDEFVPAEALYNAIFLAGGDPNRVIANAYDAVNGNRNNLNKLHDAAGGKPDPDEEALIDDIFEEISQIKESSTPEEIEQKAANPLERDDSAGEQSPLPGELIYNIPNDFGGNTDYYAIDPNPYEPSVADLDENGYSDNPEYIAREFITADLLEQFEIAITDGSGSVFLIYNPDNLDTGTYEVPVEGIRDALQLQGINTNDVLERISRESNDFEEAPEPAQVPESPQVANMFNDNIDAIKDFYDIGNDLFPSGINVISYLPSDGSLAYVDLWEDLYIARDGSITKLTVSQDWFSDPRGAGQAGWRDLTPQERESIYQTNVDAEEKEEETPATPEPEAPAAPAAPQYVYPGPKEPGYSPNNTTRDRDGAVVGKGARVKALKDGQVGTVVAVQNDPEYLRIRFDDGSTAVRSASKVLAISDASGKAPTVVEAESQPSARDVQERLDAPVAAPPRIARSGETAGVNDDSTIPDYIKDRTNKDAVQSDFSAWGSRDAEIAKAANERISLKSLEEQVSTFSRILNEGDAAASREAKDRLTEIVGDIYGVREGVTFGGELFSLSINNLSTNVTPLSGATEEEIANGRFDYTINTSMVIRDVSGTAVGEIQRYLVVKKKVDENGNVVIADSYAKNQYLRVGRKKTGFATAFNRYTENWYIANGIKKVEVYAAGGREYQGGFVWALSGFNWKNSAEIINMSDFRRQVRNKEEESDVEILVEKLKAAKLPNGEYDMSRVPTPMEFARVGWRPGANDWLGKRVLISESWNGTKNLEPTAKEQVQAANNSQIGNAEKRVKSKQNIPNVSSDGIAVIESDAFRNSPQVSPYYSQIRDVIRNNRSLATLSPSAKNALNNYISQQILDKDRSMPLDDVFRLREGLTNEYIADHGYSDPFNSAEVLSQLRVQDFFDDVGGSGTKLKDSGFSARQLSGVESGVNATFEVTHIASGQVFYVKNDNFVSNFSDTDAGVTELEASILLKAAGMQGIHDVRVGRNDRNMVVMSRAGSVIPLVNEAVNASTAFRKGVKNARGEDVNVSNPVTFVTSLDAPEDLIRMSILDMLGNNQDRHDGNWMVAFDQVTNKLRIFPVDNTVGELKKDTNSIEEYFQGGTIQEADVYLEHIPVMLRRIGQEGMIKIYKNETDKIVRNLNNPLYQPKGFEMDKIIEKWGTYDAFKDAMTARLKSLTTKGTNEYKALENVMDLEYWD